jgi:hypothetical protein
MVSISAPAQRDGRNWPRRPGSRSKYIGSLPEPERQSGPERSAAWCGDRAIVMLLVPGVGRAGYQCPGEVIQDGERDARRTSVAVAVMQPA